MAPISHADEVNAIISEFIADIDCYLAPWLLADRGFETKQTAEPFPCMPKSATTAQPAQLANAIFLLHHQLKH
jgi:hypothetical protein